jgi:hypothetical protein
VTDATGSPTSSPSATQKLPDVDLWQRSLATEHAVIWSYGLIGATGDLADAAESELAVHRTRRAACIEAVVAIGAEPVASAPAYDVKKPANDEAARRLAVTLEEGATAAYAALAGASDRLTRLRAASWLRESAIAQTRWDGHIPALPGFDDAATMSG